MSSDFMSDILVAAPTVSGARVSAVTPTAAAKAPTASSSCAAKGVVIAVGAGALVLGLAVGWLACSAINSYATHQQRQQLATAVTAKQQQQQQQPAQQQQQQQTRRRRKSTASGEVPVSKADVETAVAAARSERRDVASAQGTKTEVDPDNSL